MTSSGQATQPLPSEAKGSRFNEIATAPSGPRNDNLRILKLTLAYDGSRLEGWQRQSKERTVQGELERALQQITGAKVRVTGAGRTDSGVHAEGQVAHAVLRTRLSPSVLQRALNAILPGDIVVRSVRVAPSGFHARYDARSKLYRYTLWNHAVRPLFGREQLTHVSDPLDLPAMRRAARRLQGRHDFRAFCSEPGKASGAASSSRSRSGRPVRSTIRHLRRLTVTREGPRVTIQAEADGFLYHMVRRMAGLLIEVGKGKIKPEGVRPLLAKRGLTPIGFIPPTAPARGLCLVKIRY